VDPQPSLHHNPTTQPEYRTVSASAPVTVLLSQAVPMTLAHGHDRASVSDVEPRRSSRSARSPVCLNSIPQPCIPADRAWHAGVELSPPVTQRQTRRRQVAGKSGVQSTRSRADRSRHGERRCVMVNISRRRPSGRSVCSASIQRGESRPRGLAHPVRAERISQEPVDDQVRPMCQASAETRHFRLALHVPRTRPCGAPRCPLRSRKSEPSWPVWGASLLTSRGLRTSRTPRQGPKPPPAW
jgi:hypothetical protein